MGPRTVLTLGNFDGPHLGHRAILAEARRRSNAVTPPARVVAITFDPPPIEVLRPGSEPPRIATLSQRRTGLLDAGADDVEVLTPTSDMLGQSPERFVDHLVRRHRPVAILEGPDFRFGKGRAGDMATLACLGRDHGFEAVTVPRVHAALSNLHTVPISSSLVRWLVGRGRVADAAACLGRGFSLTAPVVQGEQRGRTIGIPTANLDPDALSPFILPTDGVYAGWAEIEGAEGLRDQGAKPNRKSKIKNQKCRAAISIGVKPTFGQRRLTVEAHLLDFDADLYGRPLTLHFARWLRDQYPFPGIEALRRQLHRDVQRARRLPPQVDPPTQRAEPQSPRAYP
jgi:riboflavin kinase/FMN adenylyltransferase